MKQYYAHSVEGSENCDKWELLKTHLKEVEAMATAFAEPFNCGEIAGTLGRLHDVGKYSDDFQNYLKRETFGTKSAQSVKVNHSTAGAKFAFQSLSQNNLGLLFAYCLAGHHAGLPNGEDSRGSCLSERLKGKIPDWETGAYSQWEKSEFLFSGKAMEEIYQFASRLKGSPFEVAMWLRMLFSSLVDADFLCTEAFMDPARAETRRGTPLKCAEWEQLLEEELSSKQSGASKTKINRLRNEIADQCRRSASLAPGFFSLTVPTGGGKTLSSLLFALKHARKFGMKRIIYVIPFTSIIEQNADVFRKTLEKEGGDIILEHHSNLREEEELSEMYSRRRLLAENWDAPVIVTTNVQFFESLFASRTSKARKLHNITDSVIILDEAQTLPPDFLRPILESLKALVRNYNSSVVLCTATQPALTQSESFPQGLENVREIISDPLSLQQQLKRTEIIPLMQGDIAGKVSDEELIRHLSSHERFLCIVNTRKHARALYEKLVVESGEEGIYHLSASMCPLHREEILKQVKKSLASQKTCRLISTQLIEAGVDIDFPVVFRAMAGLDSIAQAAGRCNREGKLKEAGKVYLFMPEEKIPPGFLLQAAKASLEILASDNEWDILSPETINKYFELLYWKAETLDKAEILTELLPEKNLELLSRLKFKEASEKFKLIDDAGVSVIIPWREKGWQLCEKLRKTYDITGQKQIFRKLQRYLVTIPEKDYNEAILKAEITLVHDYYPILTSAKLRYSEKTGLNIQNNILIQEVF